MWNRLCRPAAASCFVVVFCLCFPPPPGQAAVTELTTTLDNGLRVVVRSLPDRALVDVQLFFRAGSALEPDSLAGLAHVTEHMLARFGAGPDAGARARREYLLNLRQNAWTSAATMSFWSQCLPAFLPDVLSLQAEKLGPGPVDSLDFERERLVVLEEAAYRDAWTESMHALVDRTAFPDHPFGRPVVGSRESLGRLAGSDVTAFARAFVRPANGVLIVEGPVDPPTVLALARERLGDLPGGGGPFVALPPPPAAPRDVVVDNSGHRGYRLAKVVRVPVTGPRDLVLVDLAVLYLRTIHPHTGYDLLPGEAVIYDLWHGDYYETGEVEWSDRIFDPDQDVQDSWAHNWDRVNEAIDDLADPKQQARLRAWLQEAVSDRLREPLERATLGRALVHGVEMPPAREYNDLLAGLVLADVHDFLARYYVVGRSAAAVSHGSDSGHNVGRSLAGRVERPGQPAGTDPLALLTAAEIRPILAAYRDAGLLRLRVLRLDNGVPVVWGYDPAATAWRLSGWKRLAPIGEEKAGRRRGISELYNRVVPYDPAPATEDRPVRPWSFDSVFALDPAGDFRFGGACAADSAADLAEAVAGRLRDDRLNTSVWAAVRSNGAFRFARERGDAANIAAAWRAAQVLGAEHPAVSRWAPDPDVVEEVRYAELQKLHRRAADPKGDLTLLAFGPLPPDSVLAVLGPRFGRQGRYERLQVAPPPPGPGAIAGRIVTAPTEGDVTLTLAFPAWRPVAGGPQAGLSLLLIEELATRALESRLRRQEGWTYATRCRIGRVGGWAVPEITVTCQPGQAPAVFALVREELGRLARGVGADEVERARLGLVTDLVRSAEDPAALCAWYEMTAAFGTAPADPVAEALALDGAAAAGLAAALLPENRFVFTATGAILEDELGAFDF